MGSLKVLGLFASRKEPTECGSWGAPDRSEEVSTSSLDVGNDF